MDKKVLIIDDESDTRFLLKRVLTSHHYTVKEAGTLRNGFEVFQKTRPDIIILDVNLPDGSGINYACQFKNSENIVILISADNDQLKENFHNFCASAFLKKPFAATELLAVIEKIKNTVPE